MTATNIISKNMHEIIPEARKYLGRDDPRETLVWNLKMIAEIERTLKRQEGEKTGSGGESSEGEKVRIVKKVNTISAKKLLGILNAIVKDSREVSLDLKFNWRKAENIGSPDLVRGKIEKYIEEFKKINQGGGVRISINPTRYDEKLLESLVSASMMQDNQYGVYLDKETGELLIAGMIPSALSGTIVKPASPVLVKLTPSSKKPGSVDMTIAYVGPNVENPLSLTQVQAILVRTYPEIAAYMSAVKSGDISNYEEYAEKYTRIYNNTMKELYDEVQEKVKSTLRRLKPPQSIFTDEEKVVYSNISMYILKSILLNVNEARAVRITKGIPEISVALDSLIVITSEIAEKKKESISEENLTKLIEMVTPVIGKLDRVGELLNGLLGTRNKTMLTQAILSGLILSSDLTEDPVLVSLIGDPGTGKTITVTSLGKLIGITSIIVERSVSKRSVEREIEEEITEQIDSLTGKLATILSRRLNLPKSDVEKTVLDVSSGFMEQVPRMAVRGVNREKALRLAKKTAKLLAGSLGISDMASVKAIYEYLAEIVKIAYELGSKTEVEYKLRALSIRREMLEQLEKLRVISSAEEKEKNNGGSVEWLVEENEEGYNVKVRIDLHYLLSRFKEKTAEILGALMKMGNVYIERSQAGVATVKLSLSANIDKLLIEKEEDPLSPARRLINGPGEFRRKGVILIDEARRSSFMLESLLTELSQSALDTRRANIIITTDNDDPLKESDLDPRLDALNSRVNIMVATPSPGLYSLRSDTINRIKRLDVEGELPIVSMDELYPLKLISESIEVPESIEEYANALPLLLSYDFYVLSTFDGTITEPVIMLTPKDEEIEVPGYIKVKFPDATINKEILRPMRERRIPRYTTRLAQVLALLDKSPRVTPDNFADATALVIMSRIVPISVDSASKYTETKVAIAKSISEYIRESIKENSESLGGLMYNFINEMTSQSVNINNALETFKEIIKAIRVNPVEAARFVALIESVLLSDKRDVFLNNISSIPGLKSFVNRLIVQERLF